jgi:CheY-like chemotaxis protein
MLLLDGHQVGEFVATRQRSATTVADHGAARPPQREPAAVLVVDDSLSARRVLVNLLKDWSFRIEEAVDGAEALERVRSGRYAAIFSDIDMPRMDGLALLEQIRCTCETRDLPVVLVTSRTEPACMARAAELSATAYLTKPVSPAALSSAVAQLALG